jgi:hypothetical protein
MIRGQRSKPLSHNFYYAGGDKPQGQCNATKDGEVAQPLVPLAFIGEMVKVGK